MGPEITGLENAEPTFPENVVCVQKM